jgi:hypothetical protein
MKNQALPVKSKILFLISFPGAVLIIIAASIWIDGFLYSLTGWCSFLLFVMMFYSGLFGVAYLLTRSPIADLD